MPRRRDERARVLGPHWIKGKGYWCVTTIDPKADGGRGRRSDRYFRDEEEARDWRDLVEERLARLEGRTVETAITEYRKHLTDKGTKPVSYLETERRLRLFFSDASIQLARVTPEKARGYYAAFSVGRSVDYHRNTLAEAKSFLRWCVGQQWIKSSPLDGVQGAGRRSAGKLQLTGDEARRFLDVALARAGKDRGALGAAMLLLMGLRQSEVTKRRVRDLDLDGAVLRISDAKTKRGNRTVRVPDVLRPLLVDLARGRGPLEVLFPATDGGEHTKSWLRAAVRRVCEAAGVPVVCPHGLRGTHASLAMEAGEAAQAVAAHLGHESARTTIGHYASGEAVEGARQGRALAVLQGGRR